MGSFLRRPRSLRWHATMAVSGVVSILSAGALVIWSLLRAPIEHRIRAQAALGLSYALAELDHMKSEAADHAVLVSGEPDRVPPGQVPGTIVVDDRRAASAGLRIHTSKDEAPPPADLLEGLRAGTWESGDAAALLPLPPDRLLVVGTAPLSGDPALGRVFVLRSIGGAWVEDLERRTELRVLLEFGPVRIAAPALGPGEAAGPRVAPGSADGRARWWEGDHERDGRYLGAASRLASARPGHAGTIFLGLPEAVVSQQQASALWALALLMAITAAFLFAMFSWSRARVVGSLESLVGRIEGADPDHPEEGAPPPAGVIEIERLRLAFIRFFERFAAGRRRQTEAEGALGQVLRDAADAILILGPDRRIAQWNRGAEETLGYAAEEITGHPYTVLCPDEREEPTLAEAHSSIKDLRTRRRRKDGRMIDVSVTRSRLSVEGEERHVEVLRDVSAKRQLEEELLQSEKMAAVGKISSKVVHEIRNPLAAINLNVDLLAESIAAPGAHEVDPEAREILRILKRETRRLSQIAEEYLQFSRLPRAAFREEQINTIVAELSDFLRPELERKGITLALELDPRLPSAICDATLVRQALLNLLRNAVDAVAPGPGRIALRTAVPADHRGPEEGTIEVSDDGRGIPLEAQARIFEPFYTTKKDGTGLGLALVHQAAEEHGGWIRCRSVPGQGASFELHIPRVPPRVLSSRE